MGKPCPGVLWLRVRDLILRTKLALYGPLQLTSTTYQPPDDHPSASMDRLLELWMCRTTNDL